MLKRKEAIPPGGPQETGLTPEIKREIADYLWKAEKKYGFRAAAVDNIYTRMLPKLTIILAPDPKKTTLPFPGLTQEFNEQMLRDSGTLIHFKARVTQGAQNMDGWFQRFSSNPEEFPIKDGQTGAMIISPVIYDESGLIEEYKREAKEFFGPDILEKWAEAAGNWRWRIDQRGRKRNEQYQEYIKERRFLLNRYEVYELFRAIRDLEKLVAEGKVALMVALDGSGRPMGKAAEYYFKNAIPVSYLSPHGMRKLNLDRASDLELAANILRAELPGLVETLLTDPERVIFLEDQVWHGRTAEGLLKLMNYISKRKLRKLNICCMSNFEQSNVPSWLRRREIQGIQIPDSPDLTFKAREEPTKESVAFYKQLEGIVKGWQDGKTPEEPPNPYEVT